MPFHFALILNTDELCDEDFYGLGTDITELINYKYDEELNVSLTLNIRELNTIIPFDFRTKKQVEEAWSVKE